MTPILTVEKLSVEFEVATDGNWPWIPKRKLTAVRDVSFEVGSQETLGLVGESGSGKTTLIRAIAGTVPLSSGRILWEGTDLAHFDRRSRRQVRKEMAMIFQDPLAALNPRMTAGQIIAEPIRTHMPELSEGQIVTRVGEIMEKVGLLPNLANRYPHEFSGGQCQRIGIARALILNPKLVICDEPVAALDVSVRAQVVNLLKELQRELGMAMIFIAHDLSVIKHISTQIMVIYLGKVMEFAPVKDLLSHPIHPYTRALIASVPIPDPIEERTRPRVILSGDLPSPLEMPEGCVFESRCPEARKECASIQPKPELYRIGHQVACPFQITAVDTR